MRKKAAVLYFLTVLFFIVFAPLPVIAGERDFVDSSSGTANCPENESLIELNKKLANPVSETWSINFQQNNYRIKTFDGHGDRWNSNLDFQPVMPVSLTRNWNLIPRPVIPLFISQPHPAGNLQSDVKTTTGFGDIVFMTNLSPSPAIAGNWLLGIGPTFILPTASTDETGQGKWQAGPSVVAGYLSEKYILGVFVQNWSSFAGKDSRADTNMMNLQPIAAYFLPGGWSIGYSGNILANWEADHENTWTVPIGVCAGKVVKIDSLPVKIGLGIQWMPIRPDNFGQKWNIQLNLTPVIPKPIKGTLF
jgi:hypothetical protein